MAIKAGVKSKGLQQIRRDFLKFSRITGQGRKKPIIEAGKWAVNLITNKTLSGKDYKGKSFKKYSSSYKKDNISTNVDLFKSGKMLRALTFQAFAKKLRITVKKTRHDGKISNFNLAAVHNFGARAGRGHKAKIPKREFMGLTNKDVNHIIKIIRKFYESELKKVFR